MQDDMKSIKTTVKKFPLHPIIFALYPVLFLWVDNIDQIPLYAILRSLALSLGLAISVYALATLAYRNLKSAAFISSIIIILTLSYGHIYNFIENYAVLNNIIGYWRLLAILLLMIAACVIFIWRYKNSIELLNEIMHTVSLLLMAVTIGQALWSTVNDVSRRAFSGKPQIVISSDEISKDFKDRDIYYIVMDGYGREDFLESRFDYDNSGFIKELQELGFEFPMCTQSNYDTTVYSMISSLNMDYLTNLPIPIKDSTIPDDKLLAPHIQHSVVRKKFEELGFTTVTFKAIYPFLDTDDTDIYYDFEQSSDRKDKLVTENFQYLFFKTNVMRLVIEIFEASPEYIFVEEASPFQVYVAKILTPRMKLFRTRLFKQYEQNLYAFERLEEMPELPGNKFVYAHLFSTHQPFVFTESGQVRWPVLETSEAYVDQISYSNSRIIKIVNMIIDKSNIPPVIVLQGDHSWGSDVDRNLILNAYYLPEGGNEQVTADFSPVNTFRLIFNTYFGGNYEILPNIAYASQDEYPRQFEAIPLRCVDSTE